MSSADEDAAIIEAYHLFIISNYCGVAAMALLLFDHVLTLPGELKLVWRRRWSGVTILFMVNRYFALLNKAFLIVDSFPWPNQTDQLHGACNSRTNIDYDRIFRSPFSVLRVYAIWNRDWRPCVLVLAIGLVVPGINLYQYGISTPGAWAFPLSGCGEILRLSESEFEKWSLATHSCAIAADALVLVLTWAKTYGIRKTASQFRVKAKLTTLLLRDGTAYFATLLILNVVSLIVLQSSAVFNPVPIFIDAFTCILISRFILNLRAEFSADRDETIHSQFNSTFTAPQFASRFLGNLGAPLEYNTMIVTDITRTETAYELGIPTELSKDPLAAGLFWDEAGTFALPNSIVDADPCVHGEMEFAMPLSDISSPSSYRDPHSP